MPDAALLFGLLIPVAALLFLNLRLSRKITYPHDLLKPAARKGRAAFLFRSFRTYYDVILDSAIAISLAFTLAALPPRVGTGGGRRAVVIDCSRSMLAGIQGKRPLDVAVARLAADKSLAGADRYALAFDPSTARSRLFPLSRILAGPEGEISGDAAAARLQSSFTFHEIDYSVLQQLPRRGYGDISLLTDLLPFHAYGLRLLESGRNEAFSAYPTAARYDRLAGTWLVAFATKGALAGVELSLWDEVRAAFFRVAPDKWRIEPRPGGIAIRPAAGGLYRVSISSLTGEADLAFGFRLEGERKAAAATGPFSTRVLAVLPYLEAAPHPGLVLADVGSPLGPKETAARGSQGSIRIDTSLDKADGDRYIAPELTFARPILGTSRLAPPSRLEASKAALGLGPAALANEDLPLVYDGAIAYLDLPAWDGGPPPGTRHVEKIGGLLFTRIGKGLRPLNAGAQEYWPGLPKGDLAIERPRSPRYPWAVLLALLFSAKLLVWKKTCGKSLWAKGKESGKGT